MIENALDSQEHSMHDQTNLLSYDPEVDKAEFKSLKGIAGRRLDIDEIRRERLKL